MMRSLLLCIAVSLLASDAAADQTIGERLVRLEESKSQTLIETNRLNTQLESINAKLDKLVGQAAVSADHEERIRELEGFRWMLLGGAVAIQALSGILIHSLLKRNGSGKYAERGGP